MWAQPDIEGKHKDKDGYIVCHSPSHPNASKSGYVPEHRLKVEGKLKRFLNDDELVHHKNGNKEDNRLNNLADMKFAEHNEIHNPQGELHRNWKEDAIERQPRSVKYNMYERDECPRCHGLKDKRANYCKNCAEEMRGL